jgi:hypothetical protein
MSARILIAAALAAAALPAAADAKSFAGKTSQHHAASVLVGSDGLVERIRVSYSAPCRDARYRFPNIARFEPPFDMASADAVSDSGPPQRRPLKGGGRSVATLSVTASHHVDPTNPNAESWSGTFAVRAVLYRNGHWLDTCELKRVRWSARLVAG